MRRRFLSVLVLDYGLMLAPAGVDGAGTTEHSKDQTQETQKAGTRGKPTGLRH